MRRTILTALGVLVATVLPSSSAELCFVPSTNGINQTQDCITGTWYDNQGLGIGTDEFPCNNPFDANCNNLPPPNIQWSLSASSSDPWENTVEDSSVLYLWYTCAMASGTGVAPELAAAEFGVSGDIDVLSFTPMPGFANVGTSTNLLIFVGGCPTPPMMVGEVGVEFPTPVSQTSWGRIRSGYR